MPPNSGINYSFGTAMYWLDGNENRDDMGIEPEIWCDPSEALDSALMLLVREGKLDLNTMMKMKNSIK